MKEYLDLFFVFIKVGLFTFGGGYAMIPIVKREIIDKHGWLTESELMDFYGVAQVSMGIIAINTAALIGFKIKNTKGALIAAIAGALPSIIIIMLVATFLNNFLDIPEVINMFKAIRIVVSGLIAQTTYQLFKLGVVDSFGIILFITSFLLITFLHVNTIYLIIPSALLGILFYSTSKGKQI